MVPGAWRLEAGAWFRVLVALLGLSVWARVIPSPDASPTVCSHGISPLVVEGRRSLTAAVDPGGQRWGRRVGGVLFSFPVERWVVDGDFGVLSDLEVEVWVLLVAVLEVGDARGCREVGAEFLRFYSSPFPLLLRGVSGSSGLRSP